MKLSRTEPLIGTLYERYAPMVYRRCLGMLGDPAQAEDALHDVFVRLLRKDRPQNLKYPSSLLYTMATNHCLNLIKRRRFEADNALSATIAAADDAEERFILADFLERLFRGQRPSTRTMAYLHFIDGWSYESIGAEFKLSASGVKKRLRVFREQCLAVKGEWYE